MSIRLPGSRPLRIGLALLGLGLTGGAVALADPGAAHRPPPQWLPLEARWCLEPQRCVLLEVAEEPHEQAKGLQLRPALPPLRGMWFPFPAPTVARFWMHRTPEPLDMLFVADGRVVAIEAAAQPCPRLPCRSYGPDQMVDGVLELAAGQAAAQGIGTGTPVVIEPLAEPRWEALPLSPPRGAHP
jgi:uncharacterized membrane protein (UPF0127 family)